MKKLLNFMLIVIAFILLIQMPMSVMAETKNFAKREDTQKEDSKNKAGDKTAADKDKSKEGNNAATNKAKSNDIIQTLQNDGGFKTFISALDVAGLTTELKEDGPFTVFAPTDQAFSNLPAGKLDTLLKTENKNNLKDILSYHISKDVINSKDIKKSDGKELSMLNDKNVIVTLKNDEVFINSSRIIMVDIFCKNGVIHVIDAVLIPQ